MDNELKKILWCILAIDAVLVLAFVWRTAPMFTGVMKTAGFP